MAVSRRTIKFLPSIFQTDANRKFLSSTLDQLVSEPNFKRINGYVGRRFSPAYGPDDTYVTEPSQARQNYQLEIGFTGRADDGTVTSSVAYTDLVNRINLLGGITTNPSRLFANEYYNYSPPIDIDKLVNYKNYYWLPVGPEAIKITSRRILANTTYNFLDQYSFVSTAQTGTEANPTLVLKRGTTYTFNNTMYSGNLFIQSEPGRTGIKQFSSASSRDVAGVTNNGSATITFSVPREGAQDSFLQYPLLDQVEYAIAETFASLDNATWQFGEGMTADLSGDQFYPDNTDVIFLTTSTSGTDWTDRDGNVIPSDQRRGVWRMNVVKYSGQPAKIQLSYVRPVPSDCRVLINKGKNSGREYIKSGNNFQEFSGITAESNSLFYQHSGRDYYGRIELVDPELAIDINVDSIIGQASYTTPDGIVLSNGMKVQFDSAVLPSQYRNRTYLVDGVGKSIKLIDYELLAVPEALTSVAEVAFEAKQFDVGSFDESLAGSATPDYMVMTRTSQDLNAWSRINRWFHQDVIVESLKANNLTVDLSQYQRAQRPIIEFKENIQLFNSGRVFGGFVDHFYDANFRYVQAGQPRRLTAALDIVNSTKFRDLDRLGIKIKNQQLVIFADDASIKNTIYRVNRLDQVSAVVFDLTLTGTMSIAANTDRMLGVGTNFVDQLEVGTDLYLSDRTYIGRVRQILGINELYLEDTVNLGFINITNARANYPRAVLSQYRVCANWDSVVTKDGVNKGSSYYLNDANLWNRAQQKSSVNQDPLFDIVTSTGVSFATAYTDSEFSGCKLFSYARGTGQVDNTLGFAIKYSGTTNFTADIVFDNNYDLDTFRYRPVNRLENKISESLNHGYIRQNTSASAYNLLTNFSRVEEPSSQYQHVSGVYDAVTNYFEIGQYPSNATTGIATLRVYVNNKFLRLQNTETPEYTIETYNERIAVRIDHTLLTQGDRVDIFFKASKPSKLAYYQQPSNLEYNPYNQEFEQISFGQMRNHLEKISENSKLIKGDVFGSNNIRDTDVSSLPGTLLQHSASLLPAMAFIMDPTINFMSGCDSAAREYERFKYRFLEATTNYLSAPVTQVPEIVDNILSGFAQVKNSDFPWYYSDMAPFGNNYYETTIRVTNTAQRIFNLNSVFAVEPSNKALLIYVNNSILVRDQDYIINNNSTVTFDSAVILQEGDIVSLREYDSTDANYIPETPSKLGLYPKYVPQKVFQEAAGANMYFVQGHDGSLTPAFNDLRDNLIIELESRIYNNIKVNYSESLFGLRRVFPGKFRTTDYTRAEFNSVLSIEFLKWVGDNQLDYTTNNNFVAGDSWTWNYSQTKDLDGERVPGSWAGIYRYYYDTDRPDSHPWEMLGYTVKPSWWDTYYSWTDSVKRQRLITAVVNGRRLSPASPAYTTSTSTVYARPEFARLVPVDLTGALMSPQQVLIGEFNSELLGRNFAVGDYGTVELAWARTSNYAFAVQKVMALLKPAEYFGLLFDTARYERRTLGTLSQYFLQGSNSRPDFNNLSINGETIDGTVTRAASYLNWIHGYLVGLGVEPVRRIRELVGNSTINLTYKFGGFTDKRYINILADQVSLTSTSQSVLIPEESYQIFLNKSQPLDSIVYSAVIIEKTTRGWSVTGYDRRLPYFIIIPSQSNAASSQMSVLGTTITIYERYFPQKIRVPYGFEFTSIQQVADFLVGYQRYLVAQGIVFDSYDANLSSIRNWTLSIKEFVTWAKQGWAAGNILVLSPVYNELTVYTENSCVDAIDNSVGGSQIIGTNFDVIRNNDFTVIRDNKRTTVKTIGGQTIALLRLNLVQYEHVLVLDNRTIFADTILSPELGERQYRIKLVGGVTDAWDGDLTPPGFIYTSGELEQWQSNTDYKKGDIVQYKSRNYSALENQVGADAFNYNKWAELDSVFREGLAPNFSQNAAKFTELYDVDSLPVNESLAAYSNSLIGFKPREFFDNLGISPVSQIKFYQGYIKTKGTQNAITAFARGNFDRVESDIEIYEEWAARIGSYGAIDSSPEYSWLIQNSRFDNNPLLYQFVKTNGKADSQFFTTLDQTNLLTRPADYVPDVFNNRQKPTTLDHTWRVELFGDSVMCGKSVEAKDYAVNLARRHGYSLDVKTKNQYSVLVTGVDTADALSTVANEQSFKIEFTSLYANEPLFIAIEPVDSNDVPLSTSATEDVYLSTDRVLANSQLNVTYTTKLPYESVYLSFEPISNNEMPQTSQLTGTVFYPDKVEAGADVFIDMKSVKGSEPVVWSIEEVATFEQPSTTTSGLGDLDFSRVCLTDRVTGRVGEPPDYLLYKALESDYNLAITTRSVEGSTTAMLLAGTDGVNGVWPDNIEADIVVINHGLNDAKAGVSIDTYQNNLRTIRTRLSADKIVIWQTPAPLDKNNSNTQFEIGTNDLLPYARAMRQVALENGDRVIDLMNFADYPSYRAVDGIHPTQEGYRRIVNDLLAPTVKNSIQDRIASDLSYYEDDLKTAGYVRSDEIDSEIFDIRKYADYDPLLLSKLVTGYKIWTARDFDDDWQVHRAYLNPVVITQARADLNNKAVITCSQAHGLQATDMVAIRNLDSEINGFYQVFSVTELEFTVIKAGLASDYSLTNRSGQLFDFTPLRYRTLEQAINARLMHGWVAYNPYLNQQSKYDLIYVDHENEPGSWRVLRPQVVNTIYENVFYSNVITSNTYSIIGINCSIANTVVSAVSYSEQINFCVFSENNSEELYYTIEPATALDLATTPIIDGTRSSFANSTVSITTDQYSYELIRQADPRVDINSINNLYIFDNKQRRILSRLDLYDPAKGRILGAARAEIDIISEDDPAAYRNTDSASPYIYSEEVYWADEHVGTYWWNTATSRFVDYEHGSIKDRADNWGRLFPGSQVHVYEWIASDVLPSVHVAQGREGTPLWPNDEYYTDRVAVDPDTNTFVSKYFYWVRSITTKTAKTKNRSTVDLELMITSPIQQSIPVLCPLRSDAVALYNVGSYTQTDDSVIYLATNRLADTKIIHSDFQLVQQGNGRGQFPVIIEERLIDSICGIDAVGRLVPDPTLGVDSRIGLSVRPRQTLIRDLQTARLNLIKYINSVLIQYPVALRIEDRFRQFSPYFFANDPEPSADQYDFVVADQTKIYDPIQTKSQVRILVQSDSTFGGMWALYDRTGIINQLPSAASVAISLVRKQSFDVSRLWVYQDWYKDGYNSKTVITYTVSEFRDIYRLKLNNGDLIKVQNPQDQGLAYGSIVTRNVESPTRWELYKYVSTSTRNDLELVGLEKQTIQLRSDLYQPDGFDVRDFDVAVYDDNVQEELRYIFQGLKAEIFVNDLANEYNYMLFAVVDYILTEQRYIDWFFKTSFIGVLERRQGFNQSGTLVRDRQQAIESYIEEVKPYRTKIREFINNYTQVDQFASSVTDFDLPAYYDSDLGIFRSPSGEYPNIDLVRLQRPEYQDWLDNHKYSLGELVVAKPGYGYRTPDGLSAITPSVEIFRNDVDAGQEANATVRVDTVNYGIDRTTVTDSGTNFTLTPSVRLIGVGGNRPRDRRRHQFTVTAQGYSYFTVGPKNKLGFGLFGRSGRLALDANYAHSLINVDDWTLGSGGTATYPQNGLTTENERVRALDPWSQSSIVWENRPSGNGDADGGWNGQSFTIDPTKTYRSVVWMRRTTTDSGGVLYHGLHTNGTGDVLRLSDGLSETNPYWNIRSAADYNKDEWYLHVGFIFPHTHVGTSAHQDSGIYTRAGGRVYSNSGNINDGKFPSNATTAMQRCYHYYCNDAFTRSQFAFPRFELVDGNEPSITELLEYGPYQDALYTRRQRGYHVHKIRRADGQVASSQYYDIYSQSVPGYSGLTSADLARDLNATSSEYVVVVHTYDEPQRNRLTNDLHRAMLRCGASAEIFGRSDADSPTFKFRGAYILVGIPGSGPGRGIEHYAGAQNNGVDAYASLTFKIERGYLAALSSDPEHYGFATPFALPSNPQAGEFYSYGERRYVYDGSKWTSNKQIAASLLGDREPFTAILSPRLVNNTIRKVKTTIRFDRVQYDTKVQDWRANVIYTQGTYLSYLGQAYVVANVTYTASTFTEVGLRIVASTEFDNANDRIMGFYVPESDLSIPKDLERLVPGVSDLYTSYTGNASVTQDTILIGDTFASNTGIIAGNIKVSGGKFVDRLFSYAPEELLPGMVYDSLSIRVLSQSSASGNVLTTTTTAAPLSLTLGVVGKTESTAQVPYNELGLSSTDIFTIGLLGTGDNTPRTVTVSLLEKPAGGAATITPSTFSLLPGQQQPVTITATNNMFQGKTWYDLSPYQNHFELLDNSPTWNLVQRGMFTFNSGSDVNDRASSINTMSGINSAPGGYNTIAMWMRWTGENNGFPMEFKSGYRLWMPGGSLGFNNSSGDCYGVSAGEMAMFKNSWIFVTAVFHNTIGGSTYTGYNKIYINGTQRSLSQVAGSATSGTADIGITIANSSTPSATPDYYEFGGDITEFFAYNKELTEDEVLAMYFQTRDRYPSAATTTTTSTTSTTTSSTTTTTTLPPPPPVPPGIPATNAAWGGNGFGGTYNYRGGYSASGGHLGNAGGGSASPLGGSGGGWSNLTGTDGSYGTGGSGGGYTTAGLAGTGGILGYSSSAINATGIGNGGGGVETDSANGATAPINGGDGTGGLVRITIAAGSYTFTNSDLTAFGATRLVNGGQGIEWDNSTNVNKKNTTTVYQHALIGSFTVPAGVTAITVGIIAGGGGGATGPCVNAGGGGGGAAILINYAVSSGAQYIVKAGAGGQGGRQSTARNNAGGPPYGVDDAPWRGGWSSFCASNGTEIVYATGGNTRPDNCAGVTNADSASANTMD